MLKVGVIGCGSMGQNHIRNYAEIDDVELVGVCDINKELANELFKVANELGVDYYEAREFANHKYCHLLLPGTGVGGHCIPVYPWFLIKEMESKEKFSYSRLIRMSRELNDEMIKYWFELLIEKIRSINKPLNKVRICVDGIT